MTDAQYHTQTLTLKLHSLGARPSSLNEWADVNGAVMAVKPEGFQLAIPLQRPHRLQQPELLNIQMELADIIERMMEVIPRKSVNIQETRVDGDLKVTNASIVVSDMSPEILSLVAGKLMGLPIQLLGCNFVIHDGLLTGKIELRIVGK